MHTFFHIHCPLTSNLFADSTDSDKSTLDNSVIPESINLIGYQSVVLSDRQVDRLCYELSLWLGYQSAALVVRSMACGHFSYSQKPSFQSDMIFAQFSCRYFAISKALNFQGFPLPFE